MRPDQEEKVKALAEKLIDFAIRQCDPDNWTASPLAPKDMDEDQRGDAHWCAKYASQVLAVATRMQLLSEREKFAIPMGVEPSQKEIDAAERAAKKVLERVSGGKG